jgi:hypothetical protein
MPHSLRRRYVPRPDRLVTAVRLAFDEAGFIFTYRTRAATSSPKQAIGS